MSPRQNVPAQAAPGNERGPGERAPAKPRKSRQAKAADRQAKLDARVATSRFAVVYDTSGHKVTFGLLWFCSALLCLVVGIVPLAILYGAAASIGAYEAMRAWGRRGYSGSPELAAGGAGVICLAAAMGPAPAGIAVLVFTAAALLAPLVIASEPAASSTMARAPGGSDSSLIETALVLQCGLVLGLAGASMPLVYDSDIGAAVSLLLLVSAYEIGDYLIGSGAANAVEGPFAGIVAVLVVAFALFVVEPPPFDRTTVPVFALMVAFFAPVGQLAASAVMPTSKVLAPAVRRLDSLIIVGPLWMVALWFQG